MNSALQTARSHNGAYHKFFLQIRLFPLTLYPLMAIHRMIGITRTNIVSQVGVYYHVPRQTPLVGKGVQMVDAVNGLETCELARSVLPINGTFKSSIKEFAVVSQSHVSLHEPILNLALRTRRHEAGLLKVYTVLKSFSCRHVKCPLLLFVQATSITYCYMCLPITIDILRH